MRLRKWGMEVQRVIVRARKDRYPANSLIPLTQARENYYFKY